MYERKQLPVPCFACVFHHLFARLHLFQLIVITAGVLTESNLI